MARTPNEILADLENVGRRADLDVFSMLRAEFYARGV